MDKFYMKQKYFNLYKEEVKNNFNQIHFNLVGMPTLFWYGREGDFNLLVKNNLGENI